MNEKINFVPADRGACGTYRLIKPAEILYEYPDLNVSLTAPSVFKFDDQDIIFCQRLCRAKLLSDFAKYKGKRKIVVDYDDAIFGSNVKIPEYNYKSEQINVEEFTTSMKEYLDAAVDHITVSTDHLKEVVSEFVPKEKITVIPNCLKYSDWFFPQTGYPRETSFFFAGSDTHYHDRKRLTGDFSSDLIDYLSDKKVGVMGTKPQCLMKSYIAYPPVNMLKYPVLFFQFTRPYKFIIAPLEDNEFNKSKSNLKYLESCAVGRVCLCTSFPGSPYECAHEYQKIPFGSSKEAIDKIVNRAEEHYEEILDYQYKFLNKYWLDNHLSDYLSVIKKIL